MATFNGHKNWQQWNVSLWLNNEFFLYEQMQALIKRCTNKDKAARAMLQWLHNMGETHTADGARYTVTSIKNAMKD